MRLTEQEYWAETYKNQPIQTGFTHFDEVAGYLPQQPGLDFIEIGCAPGAILAGFCKRFGYVPHGIDYATEAATIEGFLRDNGVLVGEVLKVDFFQWEPVRKYDIVASFGFVEHFENADEVVDRHFRLAKPGGYVVITFPNFARGQKALHWLYDRENLRRHNTKVMNLEFLRRAGERNGAEPICLKYTGGQVDFWTEDQKRSPLNKLGEKYTRKLLRSIGKRTHGANPWFSPYILSVFRVPAEKG